MSAKKINSKLAQKYNPLTNSAGQMTKRRMWATAAIVVLAAIAIFFGIKYHQANNNNKNLTTNPQAAAQAAVNQVTTEVGKLVVLPTNETPTLATVNDASKLTGQAFFTNTKNGDKVLIYTQAKLAILYRPSINKVINIAPLNIGTGTSGTTTGQ